MIIPSYPYSPAGQFETSHVKFSLRVARRNQRFTIYINIYIYTCGLRFGCLECSWNIKDAIFLVRRIDLQGWRCHILKPPKCHLKKKSFRTQKAARKEKPYLLHKIIFVLTTGCCNHGTFGYSHAPLINPLSGFALWELEKPNKTRDIFKEIGAYRRLSQSSWTFLAILTPSNFSCKSPAGPFSTNSPGVENKTISEWQAWNLAMSHQNGNLALK